MAYRYTNTDKWDDSWFLNLKPLEKLLFNYLCDNCDCAGFIEINIKKWAGEINCTPNMINGALKGLSRSLIYSIESDCLYVRTFLRHQKNLPINPNNSAHRGIIKRFELYQYKFDIKDINIFIEGALKGLHSPYGNGIGNGIGNGKMERVVGKTNPPIENKSWKTDFDIYLVELNEAKRSIITHEYITDREKYHPGLNIELTLEKAINDFWAKKEGWIRKKSSRSECIDWLKTFNNALVQKMNQVWKQRESLPNVI